MKSLYSDFTRRYSLQKTLRFELIPQGETLEHIQAKGLIEEDSIRADEYKKIKNIIDDYHKAFIEKALKHAVLSGVEEYQELYLKINKTDAEIKAMDLIAEKLRKQVVGFFKAAPEYQFLFTKDLIERDLKQFVGEDKEKLATINKFNRFTTYFTGFNQNRENMYSAEPKSTSIAYRVIDQNLPRFLDNIRVFNRAVQYEDIRAGIADMEKEYERVFGEIKVASFFDTEDYKNCLTQEGIDRYNRLLGGFTSSERQKIRGINEYINLHNQNADKPDQIGFLRPLNKQILSDRSSVSFLPEQFPDDASLLAAVKRFSNEVADSVEELSGLLLRLPGFDLRKVYITNDNSVTGISKQIFGNWRTVREAWDERYDKIHAVKPVKNREKYEEQRDKDYKKIESFSLQELSDLLSSDSVIDYFGGENLLERVNAVRRSFAWLWTYYHEKDIAQLNLKNDSQSVEVIKDYLDALKAFHSFVKPLIGSGKEPDKDDRFYGDFMPLWDSLDGITPLYNKTRNFITQKPYSTQKFKLNFKNSTLLNGWDLNKEPDNSAVILRKDDKYYLGIMSQGNNHIFQNLATENVEEPYYEKMEYKLLPGPNKMLPKVFFSKTRIDEFSPSKQLLEHYRAGTHKKGENFSLKDCHELIDFFKTSISIHEDWKTFGFRFSKTESYTDISQFYREVSEQGYKISFRPISVNDIDRFVHEGKLYLFQIYNKDFSPYSKGTPNLHTIYWRMLFDERNLRDVVYKLNGEAEIFYRKASIDKANSTVHKANEPIANKNPQNSKRESRFEYNIIKDRRFTCDKFQFHVPITINYKSSGNDNINAAVRLALKASPDCNVIGIDRGERNLLYVCVVNAKGELLEQMSLNEIINNYRNETYRTDYHSLLDAREKARDVARKNWQNIESIKELKEGYLSQVIHIITKLMIKYNAIVVLEDLNMGFMRGRQKVEKQVYQKFERMLIEKLNYIIDKTLDAEAEGGALHAYQLASKFDSFAKLGKQSGFLFYTQAWNTSKIDPATGFVNLFDTRYKSVNDSVRFWNMFDKITYLKNENMFRFDFRYGSFTDKAFGVKESWEIYTNGSRLANIRDKNGVWNSVSVDLTDEMRALFKNYSIDTSVEDLRPQITEQTEKSFFEKLHWLFALTVQLRNSATGTDEDYILSPVRGDNGLFFDSRSAGKTMPKDADANGAYNIARKGLMILDRIKNTPDEDLQKVNLAIGNSDWLIYAQKG